MMFFKTLYIPHAMGLDSLITFFGLAALTYSWLHINLTFAAAIGQAIENHNDAIRLRGSPGARSRRHRL